MSYTDLVPQEPTKHTITLEQTEACTVLQAFDYGLDSLTPEQRQDVARIIAKLKDSIWP